MDATTIASYALFIGYIIIVIILGVFLTLIVLNRQRLRLNKNMEFDFQKSMINAYLLSQLTDLSDVENIYKHIFRIDFEDSDYRADLNDDLEELSLKIINDDTSLHGILPDDKKSDFLKFIRQQIVSNKNISPYANVPQAERNVLKDISQAINDNNNNSMNVIRDKTSVLAGMIEAREDTLQKIKNINGILTITSVVLAALGIVIYFIPK